MLCASTANAAINAYENRKTVLIINSYSYGYKFSDTEMEGITTTLRKSGLPIDVHIEYLDAKRVFDKAHSDNLFHLFQHKFSGDKFDLIISSDNDAFDFLKKYRNTLFPGVPVVFSGINNFSENMLTGQKNITGVVEEIDYKKTLDIALRLFPRAYDIVVVSDNTVTGRLHEKKIRDLEPEFRDSGRFIYLSLANMTMRELQVRLNLLNDKTIVLLLAHFKDKTGQTYSIQQSLRLLTRFSNAPCFVFTEDRVAYGVVGGFVVSGYYQGEEAAKAGLRILNGESADSIPVMTHSPNKYVFDYNAIKRWNIQESLLPTGSIIKNKPLSFYKTHKTMIWGVILIFTLLISLIAGLSYNILRKRKLEKLLRANEERLSTILETVPDGIMMVDMNSNPTFANSAAERILGFTYEDLSSRSYNDPRWKMLTIKGDPLETDQMPFALVKKTGQPVFNYEHSLLRSDGSRIFLSVNAAPVFSANKGLSSVIISFSNITDRVNTQKALIESQNRFDMFMKFLPGYAYISDIAGRYIYANNHFRTSIGIPTKEIIGKFLNDVLPDIAANEFRKNNNKVLSKGNPINFEEALTINGEERIFVSYKFPIPTEDGTLLLGGISIDITEQKKLEEQLRQSQKMEAIGTLAGGVAHDFNNILTAILGYAHLSMMKLKDDNQIKNNINQIIEAAQRAATLTQRLLAFSRKQTIIVAPVDLNDIARRFEQLFLRLLREDIEFCLKLTSKPLPVMVDAPQIEQALINLGTNAQDAMPKGGRLELETSTAELDEQKAAEFGEGRPGKYAVISVQDTGTGIDEGIRDKIFEPFFTTKEVGKGTGLGLSMVYGTIKKHDGFINLTSEKDKGTRFEIYLPFADSSYKK
ncbi:MAG: PAS domain S-box protein [Nitrospiraceae bacterium]|nr:PAS domain S-box protein [Nitrospiraceae bacterium]